MPITLTIDGVVSFSKDYFAYPRDSKKGLVPDLIQFANYTNFKIEGRGTVDGQGYMWWAREYVGTNTGGRSYLVSMDRMSDLEITGVMFKNSPQFHLYFTELDGAYFHDFEIYVDIYGQLQLNELFTPDSLPSKLISKISPDFSVRLPSYALNTDGIDPHGRNITIERLKITNFDDAIVPKPSNAKKQIPCTENITVRDIEVYYGLGMSLGTVVPHDSYNCIRNVSFTNITFYHPFKSVYIKSNPGTTTSMVPGSGGVVENIIYKDIKVYWPLWWNIYIGPQ